VGLVTAAFLHVPGIAACASRGGLKKQGENQILSASSPPQAIRRRCSL